MNLHIWPQPHAQNPSAGSSTSTSAFDAKSCSVGTGRSASQDLQACSLRVSSVLGAARPKTYKHARYACHIDPLLSAALPHVPPRIPATCTLDKMSSFKLVPSDNQPIQSTS